MPKTRAKPVRLPEHEIIRRVFLAGEELDRLPGGRLGWLVAFACEDPAAWETEHQTLHGYRLLACGLPPLSSNIVSLGPDPERMRSPLTPADVRRLHRDLRAWFRRLVSYPGGVPGVVVPTTGLKMVLVRMTRPGNKPSRFAIGPGGPFRTMVFQRAAGWVAATDRLLACPECSKPFLALRKRKFCSAPCLQQHHDQKKIAKRKREKKGGAQ